MKLVMEILLNGVATLKVMTTVNSVDVVASSLRMVPGVGKPFLIFNTLDRPEKELMGADFSEAPTVGTAAQNKAAIQAMLANPPSDRLTWMDPATAEALEAEAQAQ